MAEDKFEQETISLLVAIQNDVKANRGEIVELAEKVGELDRTIRGSNGNQGLVTELAVLKHKLADHVGEDSHQDAKRKKKTPKKSHSTYNGPGSGTRP